MESFGQKIKKALTRNLSKKHIERSTTNQSNHTDEKSDEPDISPRIKGPKASVNKAYELVGSCITYTQIFKNAHGNDLDPKRQGLNRDFGRVCVVTPEIAVIAIADGCGLQYWSEISAKIAANELVMYMQQSLERRNRPLSVNEVKKRLKKSVLEINDVLINARNPVTGEALAIAEQGGATTLMIAAVLPLESNLGGGIRWGVVYLGMGDSELYLVSEPRDGMPQSVPSSPRVDYTEKETVLTRNRSNSDAPKLPGERRPSVTKPHPEEKKEIQANTTIVVNTAEENNKVDSKRMSNSASNNNTPKDTDKGRSGLTNSADANRTQPKIDLNSNKTSNSAELPSRMSLSSEDKRKFLVHRKSKTDLLPRGSTSTAIKVNPLADSPPHSSPTPASKVEKNTTSNNNDAHWRKSAPAVRERSQTENEITPSNYLAPNNNNNKGGNNMKMGTHTQSYPTKIWKRICGDNGTSRFLPFVGLGERHIPEPGFVEMGPGDILIACSDGLKESFPELRSEPNQPQDPIALELPFHEKNMDAHKAFENWCRELMIHSYCCHKDNNTHPDDVTIAAVRISETIHGVPRYKGLGSKGGYPHVEPTEDVTRKIDPLFYSFVEDYWKSDPLPLKASEYHIKTSKRSSKAYSWDYTDTDKF